MPSRHLEVTEHPKVYWWVTIGYAIANVLILLFALFYLADIPIQTFMGAQWDVQELVYFLLALWFVLSFGYVRTEDIAAMTLFGSGVKNIYQPGLKFAIFGLLKITRYPRGIIQEQYPDEPAYVQHTDDKEPLQKITVDGKERYMVRPVRIVSGGPKRKGAAFDPSKENILESQMTMDVSWYTRYRIANPLCFLSVIGTIAEARKQMRDTSQRVLSEEFAKRTPAQIIGHLEEINKRLDKETAEATSSWGIDFDESSVFSPDLSHDLAIGLRNVPLSKAQAVQTRVTADAERYRLTEEGLGTAAARKAYLTAEGDGMQEIAKKLGVDGADVLAAETAKKTVGESDLVLGADGLAQALGGLMTAGHAFKRGKEKKAGSEES